MDPITMSQAHIDKLTLDELWGVIGRLSERLTILEHADDVLRTGADIDTCVLQEAVLEMRTVIQTVRDIRTSMHCLTLRVAELESVARPQPAQVSDVGTIVGYRPNMHKGILWTGTVIPRPQIVEFVERGKLGAKFVWVVRHRDHVVRGVYPWNLVVVTP